MQHTNQDIHIETYIPEFPLASKYRFLTVKNSNCLIK